MNKRKQVLCDEKIASIVRMIFMVHKTIYLKETKEKRFRYIIQI